MLIPYELMKSYDVPCTNKKPEVKVTVSV